MTVAGTGDVLTGIIAALLSVLKDAFLAASLGAYISGAAGELAAEEFGDGLMASDIPYFINKVIKEADELLVIKSILTFISNFLQCFTKFIC